MIALNEADLAVVSKIQEAKSTTRQRANEFYRNQVKKLANPDIENRAEIIWENFQRGTTPEPAEKPVKAKAEKKANEPKVPKAAKVKAEVVEVPLPALDREVELKPVADLSGVYTGKMLGGKHVVIWAERNRSNGADHRFESVGVSEGRLDKAKQYAKENDLPVALAVTVRVKDRLDQGYAIPVELFTKFKGKSMAVVLSVEARAAYAEKGWAGVKFVELKAEEKVA